VGQLLYTTWRAASASQSRLANSPICRFVVFQKPWPKIPIPPLRRLTNHSDLPVALAATVQRAAFEPYGRYVLVPPDLSSGVGLSETLTNDPLPDPRQKKQPLSASQATPGDSTVGSFCQPPSSKQIQLGTTPHAPHPTTTTRPLLAFVLCVRTPLCWKAYIARANFFEL
jgi:hypothetical protein